MIPRFLVPDLHEDRPDTVLPPGEAHHLVRVLRLGAGDEVAVFDGRGLELRGRVASVSRRGVTVRLIARAEPVTPPVALTLVQSVLRGGAMDDVVRDATMVGVEAIQPIVSRNSAVRTALVSKALERWRRIALASTKQCGRSTLPGIRPPMAFDEWLRTEHPAGAFLLVEPARRGSGVLTIRDLAGRPTPRAASLVVGPEGGWTPAEHALALEAGCLPLTLGRLTLRAAAVPLAAAAALLAVWEEQDRHGL